MAERIEGNSGGRRLLGEGMGQRPASSSVSQKNSMMVSNAGEKRYLWTARAFAIISALSICCNIVLILAVYQVMPLYRVEPYLLTFQNRSEQVYDIQPVKDGLQNIKSVIEVFVREYVLLRSTFSTDIPEMEARWMPGGPIQEMSAGDVYQDFLDNTANKALTIIRNRGLVRNVKILSVNELADGIWQVEYETTDMYPESDQPSINYWTASLGVNFRKKIVKYGDRLTNPTGFTVNKYSLTLNKS